MPSRTSLLICLANSSTKPNTSVLPSVRWTECTGDPRSYSRAQFLDRGFDHDSQFWFKRLPGPDVFVRKLISRCYLTPSFQKTRPRSAYLADGDSLLALNIRVRAGSDLARTWDYPPANNRDADGVFLFLSVESIYAPECSQAAKTCRRLVP